jgi:1-deoxyxylulose-5-phosphate synthase
MEYVKLGNSGLEVSRIALGCMGFGNPAKWTHQWVINEEQSREVIKHALDLGINFFDTANIYSLGESELYLGRALKVFAKREDIVLATKVHQNMRKTPNGGGLSRKEIFFECEESLRRLGTDYIDLYIIHRWDYGTPIEETMEALHDLVKSGKVRYIGASAMYAWQFQKAQNVAEKHGWTKFISMQNHYNLIYREEEREMNPYCFDSGVASTPYSPLAYGRLSRIPGETSFRNETDKVAIFKYGKTTEIDAEIIKRVGELAEKYQVLRSQIALAWLWNKKPVVAPIVGATKISHIDDAIAALDVKLTEDDMVYLEEPYLPHPVVGALPYTTI